jgi:fatty-acyl-CoA synthase
MDEAELSRSTIGALLDRQADQLGDNAFVAYADRDVHLSYRQFRDRANAAARGLIAVGVRKGEHVAVWAPNVPEWLVLQFATAKIGATLVPIETTCTAAELEYVLRHSESTTLFFPKTVDGIDAVAMLRSILGDVDAAPVGHAHFENMPRLSRLFVIGRERLAGMLRADDLNDLAVQTHPDDYRRRADACTSFDVINLRYQTAGAGLPKGAMLTHRNLLMDAWHSFDRLAVREDDRLCLGVPLHHPVGSIASIGAFARGACIVPAPSSDPNDILQCIGPMRCTLLLEFASALAGQLALSDEALSDAAGLRSVLLVPSPVPAEILKSAAERLRGTTVATAYGVVEATAVIAQTALDDDVEHRISSVGRPLAGTVVKIVDGSTGEDVAAGSPGELCCRGLGVMKGYHKDPQATARAVDAHGWLHTKDVAVRAQDGFIRIVGRIEDPIVRGEEKIDPREIETFLRGYPTIADVRAIGVPNKSTGEDVCAAVLLHAGETASDAEILDFCRGRMPDKDVPDLIMFVDDFPKSADGAVKRRALRDIAIERFGREEDAAVVPA